MPAASSSDERAALIAHVLVLQRTIGGSWKTHPTLDTALHSPRTLHAWPTDTNAKIIATQAENTALLTENETLAEYIDSLMTTIRGARLRRSPAPLLPCCGRRIAACPAAADG